MNSFFALFMSPIILLERKRGKFVVWRKKEDLSVFEKKKEKKAEESREKREKKQKEFWNDESFFVQNWCEVSSRVVFKACVS